MGNANRDEGKTPPRPNASFNPNHLIQNLLDPSTLPPAHPVAVDLPKGFTPFQVAPVLGPCFWHKHVRHSRFEKPAFHLSLQR